MIVEYRCSCGFKTIFPNKYFRHTTLCSDQPQVEKGKAVFRYGSTLSESESE